MSDYEHDSAYDLRTSDSTLPSEGQVVQRADGKWIRVRADGSRLGGRPSKEKPKTVESVAELKKTAAGWKKLLDPTRVDERTFLQFFKIKTDVVPDDATGQAPDPWVPFIWRPVQIAEYAQIAARMRKNLPSRIRVPKSRGHGVSSFNIALFGFCRVMRIPGYECKVIAQDQEEAEEHLARVNDFFDQIDWTVMKELKIVKLKSNRKSIVIQFGDMKTSKIRVITARKSGLGRGGGSDAIITTERPHWPEKAKQDLTGLLARLSRSKWSAHIDESTANGFDSFHSDCMKAVEGKGGYTVLFLPSYRRPNNYLHPHEFDAAALTKTLGKFDVYAGDEENRLLRVVSEYWAKEHGMDEAGARSRALSFLAWRRGAIDGECNGSLTFLYREHPNTLEEAFQGTGRPVFRVDVIRTWSEAALKKQDAGVLMKIEIHDKSIVTEEDRFGLWRVYELPKTGMHYTFGCDVSSGESHQGDGAEADWTVVNVKEVWTGRTVARMRTHIFPHDLAWEIVKMAHWYNDCRGLVEVNNYGGTVVSFIETQEVDWGTGVDCLILTERKVRTDTGMIRRTQLGWHTSRESKAYMVGIVHRFVDEVGKWRHAVEGSPSPVCPWDYTTLVEMIGFVFTERGGMEAEKGFDDCVMAEGMALIARDMVLGDGDVPITSKVVLNVKAESDVRRAMRVQEKKMADQDKPVSVYEVVPWC